MQDDPISSQADNKINIMVQPARQPEVNSLPWLPPRVFLVCLISAQSPLEARAL